MIRSKRLCTRRNVGRLRSIETESELISVNERSCNYKKLKRNNGVGSGCVKKNVKRILKTKTEIGKQKVEKTGTGLPNIVNRSLSKPSETEEPHSEKYLLREVKEYDDFIIVFTTQDLQSSEYPLKVEVIPKNPPQKIKRISRCQKKIKNNANTPALSFKNDKTSQKLLNNKSLKVLEKTNSLVESNCERASPNGEFKKKYNSFKLVINDKFKKTTKVSVLPDRTSLPSLPCLFDIPDIPDIKKRGNIGRKAIKAEVKSLCIQNFKIKLRELQSKKSEEKEKNQKEKQKKTKNVSNTFEAEGITCEEPSNSSSEQSFQDVNGNIYSLSVTEKNISLNSIVNRFLNDPQLEYVKNFSILKRGLCQTWLNNNYECQNEEKCSFIHKACKYFTEILVARPSKFIMMTVASMKDDALFVDIVMSAFKILSKRDSPVLWITFLVYLVFCVTDPSDKKFLKFWANAARFFCQRFPACKGFTSLISIFSQVTKSEEWKMIQFIKLIKCPPVQIKVTYSLIQPILNIDFPLELFLEVVESCIETQENVLEVHSMIISKIPSMKLPSHADKLFLKFCDTLEAIERKDCAYELKKCLKIKNPMCKIKIGKCVPSNFQHGGVVASSFSSNNYLKITDDFCFKLIQALTTNSKTFPVTCNKISKIVDNRLDHERPKEDQFKKIRQFMNNCQFGSLGIYLNDLRKQDLLPVAEMLLNMLFEMKISLWQLMELMKLLIFHCENKNSATVIASMGVTLVLNLVKIKDWDKAYTIVSLCQEKEIKLEEGVVFASNELNSISQFRIALLLVEVNAYKQNYEKALDLIKRYSLHSGNRSSWELSWTNSDEVIRVNVLEDFFFGIIFNQATKYVYDLFVLILKEQTHLREPIDLKKFINEVLILLLNQDNECAINLYNEINGRVKLKTITIRAILVALVRKNRLIAAKSLLSSCYQRVYCLPHANTTPIIMTASSCWLEEEIYIILDSFFELLAAKKYKKEKFDCENYEHNFEVFIKVEEEEPLKPVTIMPLSLDLINTSLDQACIRIQEVLQHWFSPPVNFTIVSSTVKLDDQSLQLHLYSRIH